jgi:hypothetical protein
MNRRFINVDDTADFQDNESTTCGGHLFVTNSGSGTVSEYTIGEAS